MGTVDRIFLTACCVTLLPGLDLKPLAGPEAQVMANRQAAVLAQWRALTVDSYRTHGIHDPSWDDDLTRLLEDVAAIEASDRATMPYRDAVALARRLATPGTCRDPLATWAFFILADGRGREKSSACIRAIAAFEGDAVARPKDGHPHFLKAMLEAHALEAYGRPDDPAQRAKGAELAKRLANDIADSLRSGECTSCPDLWLRQIRDLELNHQDFGEPVVAAIDAAAQDAHIPAWLGDGLRGTVRIGNAWAWRSSGWAKDVTPEGWRGFETNLTMADTLLTKAWQANPKDPYIPAFGCTVAGAKKSSATMETWMLRSMTACFDHPDAFNTMLNFLEPRWGGSYPRMLALGCDCADTGRFDTKVPWRLIDVAESVMSDADDMNQAPAAIAALADARFQSAVDTCLDGYLKRDAGMGPSIACYRAALHAVGGRAEAARKALVDVPDAEIARMSWIGESWHVDLKKLKAESKTGAPGAWSKF